MSHPPTGWPHDNGPTNVGAMVKITTRIYDNDEDDANDEDDYLDSNSGSPAPEELPDPHSQVVQK